MEVGTKIGRDCVNKPSPLPSVELGAKATLEEKLGSIAVCSKIGRDGVGVMKSSPLPSVKLATPEETVASIAIMEVEVTSIGTDCVNKPSPLPSVELGPKPTEDENVGSMEVGVASKIGTDCVGVIKLFPVELGPKPTLEDKEIAVEVGVVSKMGMDSVRVMKSPLPSVMLATLKAEVGSMATEVAPMIGTVRKPSPLPSVELGAKPTLEEEAGSMASIEVGVASGVKSSFPVELEATLASDEIVGSVTTVGDTDCVDVKKSSPLPSLTLGAMLILEGKVGSITSELIAMPADVGTMRVSPVKLTVKSVLEAEVVALAVVTKVDLNSEVKVKAISIKDVMESPLPSMREEGVGSIKKLSDGERNVSSGCEVNMSTPLPSVGLGLGRS